eukprot:3105138-Prymnesium_polylepis.1
MIVEVPQPANAQHRVRQGYRCSIVARAAWACRLCTAAGPRLALTRDLPCSQVNRTSASEHRVSAVAGAACHDTPLVVTALELRALPLATRSDIGDSSSEPYNRQSGTAYVATLL